MTGLTLSQLCPLKQAQPPPDTDISADSISHNKRYTAV